MKHTFGVIFETDREPTKEELMALMNCKPIDARSLTMSFSGTASDPGFAEDLALHIKIASRLYL